MHGDGQRWNTLIIPGDVIVNTSTVVPDGESGY